MKIQNYAILFEHTSQILSDLFDWYKAIIPFYLIKTAKHAGIQKYKQTVSQTYK